MPMTSSNDTEDLLPIFKEVDVTFTPSKYEKEAVLSMSSIDPHRKVIYAGKFFQYTTRDRLAWNALLTESRTPNPFSLLGPIHCRKKGQYIFRVETYLTPNDYHTPRGA